LYIAGDLNARTKDVLDFIPEDSLQHVLEHMMGMTVIVLT